MFLLSFDKQVLSKSNLKKNVTFHSTLEDINELKKLKKIHISLAISLTNLVKKSEKLYKRGYKLQAKKLIESGEKHLKTSPKKLLDPTAKEILLYDFTELKNGL